MNKKHYITKVEKIERWHNIEVEVDDRVDLNEAESYLSECSNISEVSRRLRQISGLRVEELEERVCENTEIEIM